MRCVWLIQFVLPGVHQPRRCNVTHRMAYVALVRRIAPCQSLQPTLDRSVHHLRPCLRNCNYIAYWSGLNSPISNILIHVAECGSASSYLLLLPIQSGFYLAVLPNIHDTRFLIYLANNHYTGFLGHSIHTLHICIYIYLFTCVMPLSHGNSDVNI